MDKDCSAKLLRVGIVVVFLWFGSQQLLHAEEWLGYLPALAFQLPISAQTFVMMNGGIEVLLGLLLAAGVCTTIVATLLAIHLATITVTVGYNEIGVRDFGLTLATAAIALNGPDGWCWDSRKTSSKNRK